MIAELSAGLSSLQALTNLAKTLNAANTQVSINDVKIALQEQVLELHNVLAAAQAAETTAADRIRDLEQQIVKLKNWEGEKKNYELHAVDFGAFAYMEKEGVADGKPPHWLCTNCFDNGHLSILQFQSRDAPKGGGHVVDRWSCNTCDKGFGVMFRVSPQRMRRAAPPA